MDQNYKNGIFNQILAEKKDIESKHDRKIFEVNFFIQGPQNLEQNSLNDEIEI